MITKNKWYMSYYSYYNQCIKISKEIDKDLNREVDLLEIELWFVNLNPFFIK